MERTKKYSIIAVISLIAGILGIVVPLVIILITYIMTYLLAVFTDIPMFEIQVGCYAYGFLASPPFFIAAITLGMKTQLSKDKITSGKVRVGRAGLILGIVSGVLTLVAILVAISGITDSFLRPFLSF